MAGARVLKGRYGALLASIGFGWNLYSDSRDRAKLKVSASISRLTVDGQGNFAVKMAGTNQRYVVMSVVNGGQRSIVWKGWGGKYRKRTNGTQFGILDRTINNHLPKRLQEGEEHTACIELDNGFFENIKSFFMWDASGKKWKLSWWQLRKLKAEASKVA